MSENDVNTVTLQLKEFLEDISRLKESQAKFYECIRSCVVLFWHKTTTEYQPNSSFESWPKKKTMDHQEAIRKIKEQVIPLLSQAKSCLDRNENYVHDYGQRFETLCGYIEAFFTEKQAGGGGTAEERRAADGGGGAEEKRRAAKERQDRVRDLLYELWDLFVKPNA
jgi:hypothetical protein